MSTYVENKVHRGCNQFDKDNVEHIKVESNLRKRNHEVLPPHLNLQDVCILCSNFALSTLQRQLRSHQG